MPTTVTITNITGSSPYNIWICDVALTSCVYVSTTSVIPYTFNIPYIYSNVDEFVVKIVDVNNCIKFNTITV